MDRGLIALCALLLNAALAGRRWYVPDPVFHLTRLPAQFLRDLERKLNRQNRGTQERALRGIVLAIAAILLCLLLGALCGWMFSGSLKPFELLTVTLLLPVRRSWDIAAKIRKYLLAKNFTAARKSLEDTAWHHNMVLDEFGLSRAAIELLAVNFSEKILSPVCWYLAFGLPGLFLSRSTSLMHDIFKPSANPFFGRGAAWMHTTVHWLPSRLTPIFALCAAMFLPSFNAAAVSLSLLARLLGIGMLPSPLALFTSASLLTLSLGGPASAYCNTRWIGTGTPKPMPSDIKRALSLYAFENILLFVLLGFFLW